MKVLKDERGYSLLMTLMLILLFTILGASLLALTLNGTGRNEIREDIIQSNDLAAKGIDRSVTQLTYELDQIIPDNKGISARDFAIKFDSIVNKYKCGQGTPFIQNSTSAIPYDYSVCIYNPPSVIPGTEESLRRTLTFESTGVSGKSTEKLYSKYTVGASNYPQVLNYAVGAYKVSDENKLKYANDKNASGNPRFANIPGEGNLYLNGGVQINGDLKVDNNLYLSNTGIWLSGNEGISVNSVFPSLKGFENNASSKLYLKNNLYKFTSPQIPNKVWEAYSYSDYINDVNITNSSYHTPYAKSDIVQLKKNFLNDEVPVFMDRPLEINPINFDAKKNTVLLSPTSQNTYPRSKIATDIRKFSNLNETQDTFLSTISSVKKCDWWDFLEVFCSTTPQYNYTGEFELGGTNIFGTDSLNSAGKFGTNGNLTILNSTTTFNKGAYIKGNLNIKGNTTLKGTVFVDGNLTISNSLLYSDAIFYVNGEVKLTESVINGREYRNEKKELIRTGSLIIFAKDKIRLANNSEYQPIENPSNFKAYLYSEQSLEIFGVGSNIKINGGISARKIILNGIRGNSSETKVCDNRGRNCYNKINVESENSQSSKDSRLQIIYDPEIIKTFSELDIETEPWIENVSPPTELERSYTPPN